MERIEDAVLTKAELAKRWKCSESAINTMQADGLLSPSRKLPGWRISFSQVLKLEETDIETLGPIERRRLQIEIENKDKEIVKLKEAIRQLITPALLYASLVAGGKE